MRSAGLDKEGPAWGGLLAFGCFWPAGDTFLLVGNNGGGDFDALLIAREGSEAESFSLEAAFNFLAR